MAKPSYEKAADYRRLMKDALVQLESLQGEVAALRRARSEPIAVVGVGCRFPGGADHPGAFWRVLREGIDAVGEIPPERWPLEAFYDPDPAAPGKVYCRHAALLDQDAVERFDPDFFGIAPREAQHMDPQQRLLLEVCWEALEDAAVPVDRAGGSRTGLFVGTCTDDYLQRYNNLADPASVDGYSSLGTARSITVGRVSYLLGFEGPAVQLDTACSSSLVAVHQACQSLRAGECDTALAGGVNLQLSPVWSVGLSKLRALSPSGRCRTFDAGADGFVRGEGCGVVVLRRLSDAVAARDRILALIRGSAVNHDGRSSGLTVPNPAAQAKVLRRALEVASLQPDDVDYIEAHGTGTSLGDPIEMAALGSVFGRRAAPLWVGSVKTNVGHLEAAAGIVGLVKVVLSLAHEQIPPHLHFHEPNPHVPWDELPVRIPTRAAPWPRGERRRRAGVSSFGFSGTNAHVVVEEAPLDESPAAPERPCHLLLLSAKDPQALRELAGRYAALLAEGDRPGLGDVCHTAALGRSHFEHRLAVAARSVGEAREQLQSFARTGTCQTDIRSVLQEAAREWPAPSGEGPSLDAVAERYLAGQDVDWAACAALFAGRKVALPTYPFQRVRCWREGPGVQPSGVGPPSELSPHPLLGRRIDSAAAPEWVQFESRLSARAPGYLADHRVGGRAVLPATAALEMALAAAREAEPGRRVVLERIAFHRAVILPDHEARVIQTVLRPEPSGFRFELFSRPDDGGTARARRWTRHASGRVGTSARDETPPPVSLDAIRSQCPEEVPAEDVYSRIASQGLVYGERLRCLRRAWRGRGQALGYAEMPAGPGSEQGACHFHPALFDSCLHAIAAMAETQTRAMLLPTRLERLDTFARPGHALWSHVRLRDSHGADRPDAWTVDVEMLRPDGALVARLAGLRMERIADEAATMLAGEAVTTPATKQPEWDAAPEALTAASSAPGRPSLVLARLRQAPRNARRRLLADYLRRELAAVLGRQQPKAIGTRQPLLDLGLDSIMAVELRRRLQEGLGCPLPVTLALDYPSIESLVGHLAERLSLDAPEPGHEGQEPTEAAAVPGPDDLEAHARRVAAMSEDEIRSLLAERYKDLP